MVGTGPTGSLYMLYRTRCPLSFYSNFHIYLSFLRRIRISLAVVAHQGAVVAHWQQNQIVKLQSWVRIQQSPQPTVDCQSLDGLPSGMVLPCRLSSEGRQRRKKKKIGTVFHQKTIKEKKQNQSCVTKYRYRNSKHKPHGVQ